VGGVVVGGVVGVEFGAGGGWGGVKRGGAGGD
jgi:hypothetical protein